MRILNRIFLEELPFLLACPAVLWQIFFLYMPMIILFLYSIFDFSPTTGFLVVSFDHYVRIFNSTYYKIIINSFTVAVITSFFCFIIAYPLAYFLALKVRKRFRPLLLFSLILPSWTSLIVQVYAWLFLLNKNSFFSQFLYSCGIIPQSVSLLNNYFSILIGMVSVYLPFMILPIYTAMEKMEKTLLEVSADLGANRFETLRRVVFPMSLPGVYVGIILVFLPAFGEFAIPNLLGGSKIVFWGNLIVQKFLKSRDWKAGSALAIIGVSIPAIIMIIGYLSARILRIMKALKKKKVRFM